MTTATKEEIKINTMKALVYHGPGNKAWEDKPKASLQKNTDAVVRITTSTICGTDLHIMKGDVPAVNAITARRECIPIAATADGF